MGRGKTVKSAACQTGHESPCSHITHNYYIYTAVIIIICATYKTTHALHVFFSIIFE